jgi:hypothetical protein
MAGSTASEKNSRQIVHRHDFIGWRSLPSSNQFSLSFGHMNVSLSPQSGHRELSLPFHIQLQDGQYCESAITQA